MKVIKKECSECNKDVLIVNRTKWLCDECNFMRLHDGKTRHEIFKEKEANLREISLKSAEMNFDTFKQKKSFKINQTTSKQANLNRKLSELKKEIALKAIQNDEYYCKGCGSGSEIDKSHILSIGQRKDLELVEENIQLLCRRCHVKWEGGIIHQMISLHCFRENLLFIRRYDRNRYNQLKIFIDDFCIYEVYQYQIPTETILKIQQLSNEFDYLL